MSRRWKTLRELAEEAGIDPDASVELPEKPAELEEWDRRMDELGKDFVFPDAFSGPKPPK